MRNAYRFAIMVALMALGTWFVSWWMIPLLAALFTAWHRRPGAAVLYSTLAALLAWALLLTLQGVFGGSVTTLGRDLAASLGVPATVPITLTLLLPALLAASAGGTVAALRRMRGPPARHHGSAPS